MHSSRFLRVALFGLVLAGLVLAAGCGDDDNPTGTPAATVSSDLVTIWRITSVTVDGTPQDVGDFFGFSPTAVNFHLTIASDATYVGQELDASGDVVSEESGTAVSSGETLTLTKTAVDGVALPTPEVVAQGTWSVASYHLTFTMVQDGHTVVMIWSDWNS